jgi:predicted peptidase
LRKFVVENIHTMKINLEYASIAVAIILLLASCGGVKRGVSTTKIFESSATTLPYQVFYPDVYGKQKVPVIVFLHGSGERGNDNVQQLKHVVPYLTSVEVQSKYPCVVISPQCPKNLDWSPLDRTTWTAIAGQPTTAPTQALIELIKKVKSDKNIYDSRIYIIGMSMGGFGAFDILSREPSLFAAGAPICGGADLTVIQKYSQIPIWIFHGAKDTVVPVKKSQEAYEVMQSGGFNVRYTEYPEGGHNIWEQAVREQGFLEWLFDQYRGKSIR